MQDLVLQAEGGKQLDPAAIRRAVDALLSTSVDDGAKAAFLTALHRRGETPEEIAGFVRCLLGHSTRPEIATDSAPGPLLDVCGTGGDRAGLFNVSTVVMFVCAAGGAAVVKHGNRGITSKSGGADVLEALGVPLDVPAAAAGEFLARHGFVFLFAPAYHPAFRHIAPVRKLLAERGRTTVFNILGPLLNPAQPHHQLAGVFNPGLLDTYAAVFRLLGRRAAWAVYGTFPGGGLDELSLAGPTTAAVLENGAVRRIQIQPGDAGLEPCAIEELHGGDAADNAAILRAILSGAERGPKRDLVLLNAAAAFCAAGLESDLPAGARRAARAIDSGAALESLRRSCEWAP